MNRPSPSWRWRARRSPRRPRARRLRPPEDRHTPTLNFGAGIHYCPGAQYTRLVAGQTLSALVHALPGLALTGQAPAPRPAGLVLRRPTLLHGHG
ncbi:hypothetical protein WKI68_04975 [Streptomyces sp. MS1.HAVA.3]|uniref:Cytochrome P450 n=1 Tax=Streptomyces caledonius TaxID=3134107 RepID=A0ABU8TZD3_9ACTN